MSTPEKKLTNGHAENKSEEYSGNPETKQIDEENIRPVETTDFVAQEFILNYRGPRSERELELAIDKIRGNQSDDTETTTELDQLIGIQQLKNKFEQFKELAELSTSEKRFLIDFWQNQVLGKEADLPIDIDTANNATMRRWLQETQMKRAGEVFGQLIDQPLDRQALPEERRVNEILRREFQGLDQELQIIGVRIKQEQNTADKVQLQLAYLKKCRDLFKRFKSNFVTNFNDLPLESNQPNYIEQNQEFLCSGATLLGFAALERDNVSQEYYRGAPPGHSVDIVRLADGQWCYADFANGIVEIIKPTGQTDSSGIPLERDGNLPILEFNNEAIVYQKVPIMKKEDLPSLDLIRSSLSDRDMTEKGREQLGRKKMELQSRLGFEFFGYVYDNEIMKKEKNRLDSGISSAIPELLKDYASNESREAISQAIIQQGEKVKARQKEISDYIFGGTEVDLNEIGITGIVAECFKSCRDNLNPAKINDESWKNKVSDQDFRSAVVKGLMAAIIAQIS